MGWSNERRPMEILFITHNRIGDAVLSSGALGWLGERYPQARITVACGPLPAPLFERAPGVTTVLPMQKQRWSKHWLTLWRQVVPTRWALVVDLRDSGITWGIRAGKRLTLRPARGLVHRIRHVADLLDIDPPPAPRLWPGPQHRAAAASLLPGDRPVLAVGPTANWGGKQWPAERFAALIGRLTAATGPLPEAAVAVFGALNERDAAQPVLDALPADRRLDLVGTVDLPTAGACLERVALYVGNDSGLMHLAAAAGAPTLGLFGPSRSELYAPWGPRTAVVRTPESFDEITGHPDYDYRRHDSWMGSLTVDAVESAAHQLWARCQQPAAAQ
ncbi:MAG: glycosyltransferase family 9 protein [Alphaproteobacteria bacterium]